MLTPAVNSMASVGGSLGHLGGGLFG
jgi:hypothetical protein